MSHFTSPHVFLPDDQILFACRKRSEEHEELFFHPQAAFSKAHTRLQPEQEQHPFFYKADVARIIHSKAFARYVDKTQVVYLVENDHITHRGLHVQLVSLFARGIAAILQLNSDLVEAIALGHDVGHPPFGHEGEGYLSQLSQEHGHGTFTHSLHSCRLFSEVEPLNLGLAVYDGFLCHDGGLTSPILQPTFGKSWEQHLAERAQKQRDPDVNIIPGTLEGCLVKLCDTMSYLAKDIEDAISLKILKREEVPDTVLGRCNTEILRYLAKDIVKHSFGRDFIAISEESFAALKQLRSFNFEKIYTHPKLKVESRKVEKSYRVLFEELFGDLEKQPEKSYIWRNFLYNKTPSYLASSSNVQKVVDYISGMTDTYFVRTLQKLIVPSPIELI